MKKLTTPILVCFAVFLFSCSKQTEGRYFLQIVNNSPFTFENLRVDQFDPETNLPVSTLKKMEFIAARLIPGDTTRTISINQLYSGDKLYLIRLRASLNGKEVTIIGAYRCGVDLIPSLRPGNYTGTLYEGLDTPIMMLTQ